jgi:hypothetical protein
MSLNKLSISSIKKKMPVVLGEVDVLKSWSFTGFNGSGFNVRAKSQKSNSVKATILILPRFCFLCI